MIFCVPGKNYLVFFRPASHGFKVDATLMNSPLSALALMPRVWSTKIVRPTLGSGVEILDPPIFGHEQRPQGQGFFLFFILPKKAETKGLEFGKWGLFSGQFGHKVGRFWIQYSF